MRKILLGSQVPVPPDTKLVLESDFDFITADDCVPGSDAEIFDKLEEDLLKQAKVCCLIDHVLFILTLLGLIYREDVFRVVY